MQTGTIISGAGHAALILWVVLGDWLFTAKDAPPVQVAEVSLISSAEFDAMVAAKPSTPDPVAEPVPEVKPEPPKPQPEPEPKPEPKPEPPVETVQPPEPIVPKADPVPAPAPEPAPEPLPENNGVADAEPLPVNPDFVPEVPLPMTSSPRPKPAPRVAPVPVDAPEPQTEVAETPEQAVSPDPVPEPVVVQDERKETAQEEAGTVLETEANKAEDIAASGAPATSPRPKGRPVRSEKTAQENAKPVAEAKTDAIADAIAGAVAEAASDTAPEKSASNAPSGPPMTGGEKDAFRVAVQQCWNVGSLSTDALRVTVVLSLSVGQDGVPDAGSITMADFSGGSEAAARQAYEAARRAVIRCGAKGFPLPPEKFDQWREMELVFNPDGMRLR